MGTLIKRFSADALLNLLIGVLLVGILSFAAFGYWAIDRAEHRAEAALQAGQELGTAMAAAQAAGRPAEARELADRVRAQVEATASSDTRTAGIAIAFFAAVGVALALQFRAWIRRANGRPLKVATQLVSRIAAGDLTVQAHGMDQDHTRRLAGALDEMTASLRTLAADVAQGARTVAHTSGQIAQGNLDLSERTEQQAGTLEETASSMEELTSTVAHNADNARQASQLAHGASEVARKGGQAVGQVVSTMNEISASSRRIADITGVIDGIAFQTNILALNAAVEAARAGDQGRGFAVVAAEVRTLAQRSAAAAREIKGLIAESSTKVEAGTRQVDAAGRTMQEIVDAVGKVSRLIAEIAAASQEQSAGIGQVNTAVAQMEQVVQQNASLVEEAAAATASMKEQAQLLLEAVSRFELGDAAESAPAAQRTSAARSVDTAREPPPPAPIRVRPPATALPPAYAAAIAPATRSGNPRAGGDWEEF